MTRAHRLSRFALGLCALAHFACTDAVSSGSSDPRSDGGATDAGFDASARPQAESGWVRVTIGPRRPVYAVGDTFGVSAEVFDAFGDLDDSPVTWRVDPPEMGAIDAMGVVDVRGEGQGVVTACAGDLCGGAAFFVDSERPTLVIDSPAQNARLSGFAGKTVTITGRATDTRTTPLVHVDRQRVEVNAAGEFSAEVELRFGINRISVTADDGVHLPVRLTRDVLWAPRWAQPDEDGVDIPGAMAFRLDQALLDTDAVPEIPAGAGQVEVSELAELLTVLIGLIDGDALLQAPQIAESEAISLAIVGVELGAPDIDIGFTADGIELFARFDEMTAVTAGEITIVDEARTLDGSIQANLVTVAQMRIGLDDDGALTVEAGEVDVAVEGLVGKFDDPTIEALLYAFNSQLSAVLRGLLLDVIEGVMRDTLPRTVQTALDGLISGIERMTFQLDPSLPGLPFVRLVMEMAPARLVVARQLRTEILLDARIAHRATPEPLHPDPGVPLLSDAVPDPVPGDGLGLSARLALINGLLHEIWRGGMLRMAPRLPPQFAVLLGEVTIDAEMPPILAPAPPTFDLPLVLDLVMRLNMLPDGIGEPHVFHVRLRVGTGLQVVDGQLGLALADAPILDAVLITRGDGAAPPLDPSALETFIEAALWDDLRAALTGGLDLDLSPVDAPLRGFRTLIPRVEAVRIGPAFDAAPPVHAGRIQLEGVLQVEVDLSE